MRRDVDEVEDNEYNIPRFANKEKARTAVNCTSFPVFDSLKLKIAVLQRMARF